MLTWQDYVSAFATAVALAFLCTVAAAGILFSILYTVYLLS